MAQKPIKRPRDPIALAKLIGDIATGIVQDSKDDGKSEVAIERGRKGGAVGGKSRAESLTAKQRAEIAKKAAVARWKKG